ncbi:hypothetical protein [Phenylobacterium zucineum]|nr:hypothetical protein [Phenylobacterium zucineum]
MLAAMIHLEREGRIRRDGGAYRLA